MEGVIEKHISNLETYLYTKVESLEIYDKLCKQYYNPYLDTQDITLIIVNDELYVVDSFKLHMHKRITYTPDMKKFIQNSEKVKNRIEVIDSIL